MERSRSTADEIGVRRYEAPVPGWRRPGPLSVGVDATADQLRSWARKFGEAIGGYG